MVIKILVLFLLNIAIFLTVNGQTRVINKLQVGNNGGRLSAKMKSILYMDSWNRILIKSSKYTNRFSPKVVVEGGKFRFDKFNPLCIYIKPDSSMVIVSVYQKEENKPDLFLFEKTLYAIKKPNPNINLYINDSILVATSNRHNRYVGGRVNKWTLRIEYDKDFIKQCPEEGNITYRIESVEISVKGCHGFERNSPQNEFITDSTYSFSYYPQPSGTSRIIIHEIVKMNRNGEEEIISLPKDWKGEFLAYEDLYTNRR